MEERARILKREFRRAKKINAYFTPDDDDQPLTYAYVWVDDTCYSLSGGNFASSAVNSRSHQ